MARPANNVAVPSAMKPAMSSAQSAIGIGFFTTASMLAAIAYYALLLVTLQLAFGVFGPNPVSTMINAVVAWLPQAFVAIVIVLCGHWMLAQIITFTHSLFDMIPSLIST